jgi:hypothetical protein
MEERETIVREGREGRERAARIPVKQGTRRDARNLPPPSSLSFSILRKGLKGRVEDERARAVVGGSDDTCVE